ncbi:MAG: hypothetical protein KA928_04280 [Longilinea sp.]|jgi:hypothetical protein|nr:hypothetical protein [Longilinea sp.]
MSKLGFRTVINQIVKFVKYFSLPFLLAIYTPLFFYSNNADILLLPSLYRVLSIFLVIGLCAYVISAMIFKGQNHYGATATFIFLVFFNTYGVVYRFLKQLDLFQVEWYTFLPLYIFIACYLCWLSIRVAKARFWKIIMIVLVTLNTFNILKIIPVEIEKHKNPETPITAPVVNTNRETGLRPDIYYIILDEFAGFEAVRDYWGYSEIDSFVNFLETEGFFVAENSRSTTYRTIVEMASRLNYVNYDDGEAGRKYFDAIAYNQLMNDLKSLGYTTIVFDGAGGSFAYPGKTPILADYSFEFDPGKMQLQSFVLDEFGQMVIQNTMLEPFASHLKEQDPLVSLVAQNILFTFEKIPQLDQEISGPKFVYAHIMLPHEPFIFDQDGNINNAINLHNWDYYLGGYIFATQKLQELVESILAQADPNNPPIIILQSDHGARNLPTGNPDSILLQNYPESYRYCIMNAMYLPGYDTSELPDDFIPTNTFPLIMNFYFGFEIPLVK